MSVKSVVVVLVLCSSCITGYEYKYDSLAGGWLKYHKKALWEDAEIMCDTEAHWWNRIVTPVSADTIVVILSTDAVLASPLNSQIRDAIKNYLVKISKSGETIHTGVRAGIETGDYYSVEGVELYKMPVIIGTGSADYNGSQSCVKWLTGEDEVMYHACEEKLPYVCFKKRKNLAIAGCGTTDPEYKYEERTGSCYKMHTQSSTWIDAYKKCRKENAHLALGNGKIEVNVLKSIFKGESCAFMGFRKWEADAPWLTVDKAQPLYESGFTGWASGEPNNQGGNELCGCMYQDGTYNDRPCDILSPFICEKKPDILYN